MAAPALTLDAAQDLLAAFDVGDDPDARAFLADLLASGAAPQDEVDMLCQMGQAGTDRELREARLNRTNPPLPQDQSPTDEARQRKRPRKRRRRLEETGKDAQGAGEHKHTPPQPGCANSKACQSPFFDDCICSESEHGSTDSEDSDAWVIDSVRASSSAASPTKTVAIITRRTVLNARPGPCTPSATTPASGRVLSPAAPRASPVKPLGVSPASPRKTVPCRSPTPTKNNKDTPRKRGRRETTSYFFSPPGKTHGPARDDSADDEAGSSYDNQATPAPSPSPSPTKPSRRGLVSALPFPPLDSPSFGLVQEQLADEPFWLLVALVFLTRVAGRVSLPVFWAIKQKYPTPESLVDADCARLMASMRHLGMASVRCAAVQRYARSWIEQPPRAGVLTTVKNYPPVPVLDGGAASPATTGSQWEIGHLTQGAYSVDSWRIFCRDRLLRRSTDWKGDPGHASTCNDAFQPEWMRVLPQDKELRACLRWMWMREGWDWDPMTGDRTVLRDELRRAVNDGRVGYDAQGQLQIVKADVQDP